MCGPDFGKALGLLFVFGCALGLFVGAGLVALAWILRTW